MEVDGGWGYMVEGIRSVVDHLGGGGIFQLLTARTMFVLARYSETICHYMSKCKTGAPCIVMCHLFKLLGPFDSALPVI